MEIRGDKSASCCEPTSLTIGFGIALSASTMALSICIFQNMMLSIEQEMHLLRPRVRIYQLGALLREGVPDGRRPPEYHLQEHGAIIIYILFISLFPPADTRACHIPHHVATTA